jgi:hypothetical protein
MTHAKQLIILLLALEILALEFTEANALINTISSARFYSPKGVYVFGGNTNLQQFQCLKNSSHFDVAIVKINCNYDGKVCKWGQS